jgi:hypothetical protein
MSAMKKIMTAGLASVGSLASSAVPVHAHCPLCTGVIGVAAVSASYYGLDASIIGLFVGSFGVSTGYWVGKKVKKEYVKYQLHLIALSSLLFTVGPLLSLDTGSLHFSTLFFGEPGSLFNRVHEINSLVFGGLLGGVVSMMSFKANNYIKKKRGRVLFPFQGIVFAASSLLITSAILYFIIL